MSSLIKRIEYMKKNSIWRSDSRHEKNAKLRFIKSRAQLKLFFCLTRSDSVALAVLCNQIDVSEVLRGPRRRVKLLIRKRDGLVARKVLGIALITPVVRECVAPQLVEGSTDDCVTIAYHHRAIFRLISIIKAHNCHPQTHLHHLTCALHPSADRDCLVVNEHRL